MWGWVIGIALAIVIILLIRKRMIENSDSGESDDSIISRIGNGVNRLIDCCFHRQ